MFKMTLINCLYALVIVMSLVYYSSTLPTPTAKVADEIVEENEIEDSYPPCACSKIYWPVEGSDGKTYANRCTFNCAKNSAYGKRVNLKEKRTSSKGK